MSFLVPTAEERFRMDRIQRIEEMVNLIDQYSDEIGIPLTGLVAELAAEQAADLRYERLAPPRDSISCRKARRPRTPWAFVETFNEIIQEAEA